jgi:uncharacterized protein (UPF0548 family)
MRFSFGWPATPPDCERWRRRDETDDRSGSEGDVDRYEVRLTARPGEDATALFQRATARLWSYDIFPPSVMRPTVCSDDGRVQRGSVIVQRVRIGPVVIEAGVRVIDTWTKQAEDLEEAGFAYATLAGHPERGVSRFRVSRVGDDVAFGIEARSRPGTLVTRIGRPMSRRFQLAATRDALTYFASDRQADGFAAS